MPLILSQKVFGTTFKFYSNLDISNCPLKIFPLFYQQILTEWSKYFSSPIRIPSRITSHFLRLIRNLRWCIKPAVIANLYKELREGTPWLLNHFGSFGKSKYVTLLFCSFFLPKHFRKYLAFRFNSLSETVLL